VRVPLSWLGDYVDVELTAEQLAERLTLLGMEVKGIERWGADWRSVVVGELLTVERHPRADRLFLTTVTVGSGEILEIVCGATNIAPGQRVPVALPGAILPGDRRIERTEKMGVVSHGMLCSGDELRRIGPVDPDAAPLSLKDREVILVDDVIHTGRTVKSALSIIFRSGRPQSVRLAVLVDRGHREVPVKPNYVGKNIPSSETERVRVRLRGLEQAAQDQVVIYTIIAPVAGVPLSGVREGKIAVR